MADLAVEMIIPPDALALNVDVARGSILYMHLFRQIEGVQEPVWRRASAWLPSSAMETDLQARGQAGAPLAYPLQDLPVAIHRLLVSKVRDGYLPHASSADPRMRKMNRIDGTDPILQDPVMTCVNVVVDDDSERVLEFWCTTESTNGALKPFVVVPWCIGEWVAAVSPELLPLGPEDVDTAEIRLDVDDVTSNLEFRVYPWFAKLINRCRDPQSRLGPEHALVILERPLSSKITRLLMWKQALPSRQKQALLNAVHGVTMSTRSTAHSAASSDGAAVAPDQAGTTTLGPHVAGQRTHAPAVSSRQQLPPPDGKHDGHAMHPNALLPADTASRKRRREEARPQPHSMAPVAHHASQRAMSPLATALEAASVNTSGDATLPDIDIARIAAEDAALCMQVYKVVESTLAGQRNLYSEKLRVAARSKQRAHAQAVEEEQLLRRYAALITATRQWLRADAASVIATATGLSSVATAPSTKSATSPTAPPPAANAATVKPSSAVSAAPSQVIPTQPRPESASTSGRHRPAATAVRPQPTPVVAQRGGRGGPYTRGGPPGRVAPRGRPPFVAPSQTLLPTSNAGTSASLGVQRATAAPRASFPAVSAVMHQPAARPMVRAPPSAPTATPEQQVAAPTLWTSNVRVAAASPPPAQPTSGAARAAEPRDADVSEMATQAGVISVSAQQLAASTRSIHVATSQLPHFVHPEPNDAFADVLPQHESSTAASAVSSSARPVPSAGRAEHAHAEGAGRSDTPASSAALQDEMLQRNAESSPLRGAKLHSVDTDDSSRMDVDDAVESPLLAAIREGALMRSKAGDVLDLPQQEDAYPSVTSPALMDALNANAGVDAEADRLSASHMTAHIHEPAVSEVARDVVNPVPPRLDGFGESAAVVGSDADKDLEGAPLHGAVDPSAAVFETELVVDVAVPHHDTDGAPQAGHEREAEDRPCARGSERDSHDSQLTLPEVDSHIEAHAAVSSQAVQSHLAQPSPVAHASVPASDIEAAADASMDEDEDMQVDAEVEFEPKGRRADTTDIELQDEASSPKPSAPGPASWAMSVSEPSDGSETPDVMEVDDEDSDEDDDEVLDLTQM